MKHCSGLVQRAEQVKNCLTKAKNCSLEYGEMEWAVAGDQYHSFATSVAKECEVNTRHNTSQECMADGKTSKGSIVCRMKDSTCVN